MAFTMHSHSGQFCPGHAKDQLEDVIQRAISLNMRLISLTEHMPRTEDQDLYPEEIEAGDTVGPLLQRHQAYLIEAHRLRTKYAGQIQILIGFEGEWIRSSYAPFIKSLAADPLVDFFIGSVHHTHNIPVDYDRAMYEQARQVAGGSDEKLFEDYFDAMLEMLDTLRPPVVAHFDLIRLFSDAPNQDLKSMEGVWSRIVKSLKVVVEQGALLEVNSSALRKGLKEPYPSRSVCEEFLKLGGKFTLSDDSHGVAQVGLNFQRVKTYLEDIGVETLWYPERKGENNATGNNIVHLATVQLKELKVDSHPSTS